MSERLKPTLPFLPDLTPELSRFGPTDHSNWVVPGHILCGGYPGGVSDHETEAILLAIIRSGVTAFVCLQEKDEVEEMPTNYPPILLRLAQHSADAARAHVLRFPISDNGIGDDGAVVRLVGHLIERLQRRETLYIHCAGGHGRTGTVVACLLGALYNLTADEALWCTNRFHEQRVQTFGVGSPATPVQFDQVRRVLAVPPGSITAAQQQQQRQTEAAAAAGASSALA